MMRAKALQLALLLLSAAAFGSAREEDLDRLKAEAREKDHPKLYAEVVRRQVEIANDLYTEGDIEKAQTVLTEIVSYTGKCVDSARATPSSRRLKDAELTLSKAARRLEEVRRSLAFDEQPPVKDVVDRIEKARRALLELMFKKPDKKKEEPKPRAEEAHQ